MSSPFSTRSWIRVYRGHKNEILGPGSIYNLNGAKWLSLTTHKRQEDERGDLWFKTVVVRVPARFSAWYLARWTKTWAKRKGDADGGFTRMRPMRVWPYRGLGEFLTRPHGVRKTS